MAERGGQPDQSAATTPPPGRVTAIMEGLGGAAIEGVEHAGSVVNLLLDTLAWIVRRFTRAKTRIGWPAIATQIVRVGVRSIAIVSLKRAQFASPESSLDASAAARRAMPVGGQGL